MFCTAESLALFESLLFVGWVFLAACYYAIEHFSVENVEVNAKKKVLIEHYA